MQPLPKKHPEVSAAEVIADDLPVLDVRAPVEFEQGSLPNARNLPILTNDERAAVGTRYREAGHDAAEKLGYELVSGKTRSDRIAAWTEFVASHPRAVLSCWRGGQRSQIAQHWLADAGFSIRRVAGGYKAMRHACMTLLETAAADADWWVVAGRTGTGKTVVIRELVNAIDLEAAANHRGSAFGAKPEPQPAQATFENALACAYRHHPGKHLIVEDESRTIGRLGVPVTWHQRMQAAPLVLVEATLEERVAHIRQEYVVDALTCTSAAALASQYVDALGRIRKRLGGALHATLERHVIDAFDRDSGHETWIEMLLAQYYDPMYDYQLKQKTERIAFRGDRAAVTEYLRQHAA